MLPQLVIVMLFPQIEKGNAMNPDRKSVRSQMKGAWLCYTLGRKLSAELDSSRLYFAAPKWISTIICRIVVSNFPDCRICEALT